MRKASLAAGQGPSLFCRADLWAAAAPCEFWLSPHPRTYDGCDAVVAAVELNDGPESGVALRRVMAARSSAMKLELWWVARQAPQARLSQESRL